MILIIVFLQSWFGQGKCWYFGYIKVFHKSLQCLALAFDKWWRLKGSFKWKTIIWDVAISHEPIQFVDIFIYLEKWSNLPVHKHRMEEIVCQCSTNWRYIKIWHFFFLASLSGKSPARWRCQRTPHRQTSCPQWQWCWWLLGCHMDLWNFFRDISSLTVLLFNISLSE